MEPDNLFNSAFKFFDKYDDLIFISSFWLLLLILYLKSIKNLKK